MAKGTTRIGVKQPELEFYTIVITTLVKKIYEDDDISPKEQQEIIKGLAGITRKEMVELTEKIFGGMGPDIADEIKKIINKNRGKGKF